MTPERKWLIRKAELTDVDSIVILARRSDNFLMPYVLNRFVLGNYVDQFFVAVNDCSLVGGALHVIPKGSEVTDRVSCFLHYVKQVPDDIIISFNRAEAKIAIVGQIVCPEKGSFYSILEEVKCQYDELWCWMSVIGPSYESYQRYGFRFGEERTFWNVYKNDYSTFTLGKWIRR